MKTSPKMPFPFTAATHVCLAAAVLLQLTSCGQAKWQETASRRTGDPIAEQQVTNTTAKDLEIGEVVYTNPDRIRTVNTPDESPEDSSEALDRGTQVEVVDNTPQGPDELVQVQPKPSPEDTDPPKPVFIPAKYISKKAVSKNDRFFVVENIATERLRVYERCTTAPGCAHRLVFETEMVAGEDTPDHKRRSLVGSFVIDSWTKFYEDVNRQYPSWLQANGPELPAPGASLEDWVSLNLIPKGYRTKETRGAFGWFTAKIRPNADEQWTHGTWGHGADGDKFIKAVKASSDLRVMSHGCSRVENQAIALMHEILPAGTKLIKIYAREILANSNVKTPAPMAWEWILTEEGARKSGPPMSASLVKSTKVLEKGTFSPNQTPVAHNGNVYKIDESEFRGTFVVDEGRFENYEHPASLAKGGYQDRGAMPKIVKKSGKRRSISKK